MSRNMEGGLRALVLASAAVLAALWPLNDRSTQAQDNPPDNPPTASVEQKPVSQEGSAAKGRVAFRIYCASCHGTAAKGDGPVGKYLKIPPTDLTRLAAKNKGTFPADRAFAAIDGRNVPAHGPRDMPVWGLSFQTPGNDANQEAEVQARIADLVAFLKTVQESAAQ